MNAPVSVPRVADFTCEKKPATGSRGMVGSRGTTGSRCTTGSRGATGSRATIGSRLATGSREFALFFLGCVVIAALYGAWSVNKRIFFVQGVPALAALAALLWA